jgi:membrane protease YdiL (CAAX protease family)
MIPWRPLLIVVAVSTGTTTAIAILAALTGWTVHSPAWAALAPVAMWAPALGRFVAQRTVDRGFTSTLPLRRSGVSRARIVLWPLAVPLIVYGAAYGAAWMVGLAHWSPGGGRWTTGGQIALNLVVNLAILGVFGTFTALGEELGWRGYLQPRLDAAGVRKSVAVVGIAWAAFHTPLIVGAGYVDAGDLWRSIGLSLALDLPLAFLWAYGSYRLSSLWPAVLFHSFHNTISQWLFPRFFAGGDNELWLGEGGFLPLCGYVVVSAALYAWMRVQRRSWQALARSALETPPHEPTSAQRSGQAI